jgi:DNA-binding CsgD family transcriptional regulator
VNQYPTLRPVERRVLALLEQGVDEEEIARRFRRSPQMIRRIAQWASLPRPKSASSPRADRLRPLERRVLRWRAGGVEYAEIGPRFRRSPAFVQRVEALAHYKLGRPDRR